MESAEQVRGEIRLHFCYDLSVIKGGIIRAVFLGETRPISEVYRVRIEIMAC